MDIRLGHTISEPNYYDDEDKADSEAIWRNPSLILDNDTQIKRQHRFFMTMICHPEYLEYVRTFVGMLWVENDNLANLEPLNGPFISEVWRILRSFINLRQMIVFFIRAHRRCERKWGCSDSKKGKANFIRFRATMLNYPAPSILNLIDPTRLTCVSISIDQATYPINQLPSHIKNNDRITSGYPAEDQATLSNIQGFLSTVASRCTALSPMVFLGSEKHRPFAPFDGEDFDINEPDISKKKPGKWESLIETATQYMESFEWNEYDLFYNIPKRDGDEPYHEYLRVVSD